MNLKVSYKIYQGVNFLLHVTLYRENYTEYGTVEKFLENFKHHNTTSVCIFKNWNLKMFPRSIKFSNKVALQEESFRYFLYSNMIAG